MLPAFSTAEQFDFKRQLFEEPSTLSLSIDTLNESTGYVKVNGGDSQCPTTPFTWDWGDSNVTSGFFPQEHIYSDVGRNYILSVTSHYSSETTDTKDLVIRFTEPSITPIALPDNIAVTIPSSMVSLTSRWPGYGIPGDLTYFDNTFFTVVPRSVVEYIFWVAAAYQMELVNNDVVLINGRFQQVLLRDPDFGGMYSLWYTSPVSFGAGDYAFEGTIQYSSFFHEMGHNFTLNSPASYHYGGNTDGSASTMYSETMAQIFQHATAYEIINNNSDYGFGEVLTTEIKHSAENSMWIVRNSYEDYINGGKNFCSWNDPSTSTDETFNTFMTIAYKFFEHAENDGMGYEKPLQRMMELLQMFDEEKREQYDPEHNSTSGATFRATLMVAAISYGFGTDLRGEFAALNFPIDDAIYENLYSSVPVTLDYFVVE